MTGHGVVLYGPPAGGKDTVTEALQRLRPDVVLFPRLKAGPGRSRGYRMVSPAELDAMRARGELVWENRRYGSVYAVDSAELVARLHRHVPVVHLGQAEAVEAVRAATPGDAWLVVQLWCPRAVAELRLVGRGATDVTERLAAWDETERLAAPDLDLDTAAVAPDEAAAVIARRLQRGV